MACSPGIGARTSIYSYTLKLNDVRWSLLNAKSLVTYKQIFQAQREIRVSARDK